MKNVDFLIINNCPSFYKINLYNELNKSSRIFVVFIALTDQVVINNGYKKEIEFPYIILENQQIEKRSKLKCFFKLYFLCKKIKYKKIIFGGYDLLELFLLAFAISPRKNVLQCESSIKESKISGIIGIIKRLLFLRFYIALPSGKLHSEIFKALKFKGKLVETMGVGIFNKQKRTFLYNIKDSCGFRYIYVGRLIPLKNLKNLVLEFNKNGRYLSIVGAGVLEKELMTLAKDNIHFLGFIPNSELGEIYQDHHVFILPSYSEPWGLVVEEAIYWGLPVIVSDAVGCQEEMVLKPNTGIIYKIDDIHGLSNSIQSMESNYSLFRTNVLNFDFEKRDKEQVDAYLKLIKL